MGQNVSGAVCVYNRAINRNAVPTNSRKKWLFRFPIINLAAHANWRPINSDWILANASIEFQVFAEKRMLDFKEAVIKSEPV
jgi:hypothetical protein